MNILHYLIPPIVGGIIALSTNWLSIKMLFKPPRAKYIFGIRVPFTPGLIPKERERLTEKIAEAISSRLLTPEVLAQSLSDPSLWPLPDMTIGEALASWGIEDPGAYLGPLSQRAKEVVDRLLPGALAAIPKLEETLPELDAHLAALTYKVIDDNLGALAKMFLSKEKIYAGIKNSLLTYLSDPQNYEFIREKLYGAIDGTLSHKGVEGVVTEKLYAINIKESLGAFLAKEKRAVTHALAMAATYIAQNMPIRDMIVGKLNAFDIAEAEALILEVAGRELKLIIWLGGFLGLVIGGLSLLL
ncbi:MAG: DUF445 family protein [Defluviitaleaceae bacterium]|nr:DUF445 family protein [Defluviitaleaceae bacterium]